MLRAVSRARAERVRCAAPAAAGGGGGRAPPPPPRYRHRAVLLDWGLAKELAPADRVAYARLTAAAAPPGEGGPGAPPRRGREPAGLRGERAHRYQWTSQGIADLAMPR
jgi:hypothetical protein